MTNCIANATVRSKGDRMKLKQLEPKKYKSRSLSVRIPDDIWREFEQMCINDSRSITTATIIALRLYVLHSKKERKVD